MLFAPEDERFKRLSKRLNVPYEKCRYYLSGVSIAHGCYGNFTFSGSVNRMDNDDSYSKTRPQRGKYFSIKLLKKSARSHSDILLLHVRLIMAYFGCAEPPITSQITCINERIHPFNDWTSRVKLFNEWRHPLLFTMQT